MRPWTPWYLAPRGQAVVAGDHAGEVAVAADLPLRLDPVSALQLLAFDAYDVRRSFFEGVQTAPLGSTPSYARGRCTARPPPRLARRTFRDPDEAAGVVRSALDEATREVMRGAARVGVLLSGGLDSSAVAVSAAQAWRALDRDPPGLRFYHFLPPAGDAEVAHARSVAAYLRHELIEVPWPVGQDEALRLRLARALDVPSAWTGPEPSLAVLERMAEEGVTVFLTGVGGDEAFAAYGMRAGQPAFAGVAARWGLGLSSARGTFGRSLRRALPRARRQGPVLPDWLAAQVRGWGRPQELATPRPGLRGTAARRDASLRCARQGLLVHWWARGGGLFGLKAAHPLLDSRVSELVLGMPQWMLAVGAERKPLLRRVVEGALPGEVAARPKDQPLVEPWLVEFLRAEAGAVEDLLSGGALERLGLLPPGAGGSVVRAALAGEHGALYRALAAAGLERWVRARGL